MKTSSLVRRRRFSLRSFARDTRGDLYVQWIVIFALVVAMAIGAVKTLGTSINGKFDGANTTGGEIDMGGGGGGGGGGPYWLRFRSPLSSLRVLRPSRISGPATFRTD